MMVPLTNGLHVEIDDEDHDKVRGYTWYAGGTGLVPYAIATVTEEDGSQWTLYMHKLIMNPPDGVEIDHKDRNPLNCRRSNMRFATRSQNMANRSSIDTASGYRGVYANGVRWMAQIRNDGMLHYLGTYDTPIEAAHVYDKKAKELQGEFATLNFPVED